MEANVELLKIIRESFLNKWVTIYYSDTIIGKHGEYLSDIGTMVKIQEPGLGKSITSGYFEVYIDNRELFLNKLEKNMKFMQDIPAFEHHNIDQKFIDRYIKETSSILKPSIITSFSIGEKTVEFTASGTKTTREIVIKFNNFAIKATNTND